MTTRTCWSGKELNVLRSIWAENKTIESQMHLLPGRTLKAAKHQARRSGLVKAYSGELARYRALAIIREHGPMSAVTLARHISRSHQNAHSLILQLRDEGRIYIAGHEPEKRARVRTLKLWAAGSSMNAPTPRKMRVSKRKPEPIVVEAFQIPPRDSLTAAFFGSRA